MPEKDLIVIICQNPTEEEKIFRKVSDQIIIPPDKMKLLSDQPVNFLHHSTLDYPSMIRLNIPEGIEANGIYLSGRKHFIQQDKYTGFYYKLEEDQIPSKD
jgi:hypothetical protein